MEDGVAVAVLCIVVGGFVAQWIAWRLMLPGIVLLFATGLLVGPGFGLLHPSAAFGPGLQPIIGLAVAIIVFEGGLALDVRELRSAGAGILRLTTVALPLNWLFGTLAARFVGGLDWSLAVLFGAILVVTGPTVILPLLRQSRLERRAASFLKWEAILNDPIGAILATLVLEILVLGVNQQEGGIAAQLGARLALGVVLALVLGIGAALLVRWAFRRDQMPEILKTPMLLAFTLGVYAFSNLILHEAGLIAATVFGVALANLRVIGLAELRRFKEGLVALIVSSLFIVLTADLDAQVLSRLSWPIVALTLTVLFLVRPAAVFLATLGSGMTLPERILIGWIGPRGIVAAAVAGVAGLQLEEAGYAGAELIQPAVFAVIAATVVAHGFSLRPLARRLGLAAAERPGVAIVGASAWTVDLAAALQTIGVPVVLFDIYPGALEAARRQGTITMQAEILSKDAEERLAESQVDYLFAATPDEVYNALVCTRLAPELGRERVYQLAPESGQSIDPQRGLSRDWRGKVLAGGKMGYRTFERRHEQGWRFAAVGGKQGPNSEQASDVSGGVPLLIVRESGRLDIVSPEDARNMKVDGDCLVLFAPPSLSTSRDDSDGAAWNTRASE